MTETILIKMFSLEIVLLMYRSQMSQILNATIEYMLTSERFDKTASFMSDLIEYKTVKGTQSFVAPYLHFISILASLKLPSEELSLFSKFLALYYGISYYFSETLTEVAVRKKI